MATKSTNPLLINMLVNALATCETNIQILPKPPPAFFSFTCSMRHMTNSLIGRLDIVNLNIPLLYVYTVSHCHLIHTCTQELKVKKSDETV